MFNFSQEKKQKYARVIVLVTIVGLVMAYVPLIFSPAVRDNTESFQASQERVVVPTAPQEEAVLTEASPSVATPTSTASTPPKTDGFSGLQEEGQSLDELNKLLEE